MTTSALNSITQPRSEPTAESPVEVRVSGLNKIFKRRGETAHVLKNVELEARKGELLVLLGPSGCGKTTLLRCLVGLERPGSGRIELGGETVVDPATGIFTPPNSRNIGMVFQNYALWPHMKVAENVAYPLKARKLKQELKAGRVEEVLRTVQCDHLADRYPPELSGGQQQRVSLARALAPKPAVLLFDEPLSNLDALLRIEMRAQLRLLHRTLGFTGVYVTHDQEEALALGTRVAVLNSGRVEQVGRPSDVFTAPATETIADFLGVRNTLPMVVDSNGPRVAGQSVARLNRFDDGSYTLRLRPSHLRLRAPGESATDNETVWLTGAEVIEVLPGADRTEHILELNGTRLYAEIPTSRGYFHGGDAVDIGLPREWTLCYDSQGALVEGIGHAG